MFCEKCGTNIAVGEKFCPNCGSEQCETQTAKKKVGFSRIAIITIIFLCVAVILFAIILPKSENSNIEISINNSPESVVTACIEAMSNLGVDKNLEKYLQCMPDYYIRNVAQSRGLPANTSRSQLAKVMRAYVATSDEEISCRDIEVVSCTLTGYGDPATHNWYGLPQEDIATISRLAYVDLTYQENGNEIKTDEYTCIEIDGKWYIWLW